MAEHCEIECPKCGELIRLLAYLSVDLSIDGSVRDRRPRSEILTSARKLAADLDANRLDDPASDRIAKASAAALVVALDRDRPIVDLVETGRRAASEIAEASS